MDGGRSACLNRISSSVQCVTHETGKRRSVLRLTLAHRQECSFVANPPRRCANINISHMYNVKTCGKDVCNRSMKCYNHLINCAWLDGVRETGEVQYQLVQF